MAAKTTQDLFVHALFEHRAEKLLNRALLKLARASTPSRVFKPGRHARKASCDDRQRKSE
ncbi:MULTISPECIES: hypothetical protein [unclassified Caballeronia]|uniref:hypothetical protein n=1 Tax=unclassified Caballeronia TaxID=2646786 RepID=UPI0020287991|nr:MULTISPECIES: hypothetical protein [unclassified Caballeronia]